MLNAYLRNRISTEAGRNRIAGYVAAQLTCPNPLTASRSPDWAAGRHNFNRWGQFIERLNRNLWAMNQDAMEPNPPGDLVGNVINLRNAIGQITAISAAAGIYTPTLINHIIANRNDDLSVHGARRALRDYVDGSSGHDRLYMQNMIGDYQPLFECTNCGSLEPCEDSRSTYHDDDICPTCARDHFVFSDYCNRYIREDEARYALDRNGNEVTVHEEDENFTWSDDDDTYVHVSMLDRGVIRAYHSSKEFFAPIHDDWTRQHNRHMGIELEVEAPECDPRPIARKINDTANGGRVGERLFFERDGSLTNGFEIITQPMSLPMIRETFEFLKHPQNTAGLRSHRTTTCGLHVHVSRAGLTNVTIGRAVTFVNDPRNDSFVMALARRYNTGYCKIVEKDPETAHLPADRYEAINLTPRNTIEFRLFRGSLKYDAVIAAAEFAHALLAFCARPDTTSSEMNPRTFLLWCAANIPEDTKIMRDYVNQRTAGTFAIDVAA